MYEMKERRMLRKFRMIRYYLVNRFAHKTHMLRTYLPKGEFHEMHDRVLHASFEALVDWIEIECAHHGKSWSKDELPWWYRFKLNQRDPKAGLEYLNWCVNLRFDSYYGGDVSKQSSSAEAAIELYLWWKTERPSRTDPYNQNVPYESMDAMEKSHLKDDQYHLCRLARLLDSLWL